MTDHYTAWNGQQYAGSPPSGWYQASDGRWWAPNTGPGAPSQLPAHGLASTSQTNQSQPNAKRAGLITGGTFLAIAVGLMSFAAVNRESTPTPNSTDFNALTPTQQTAEFRKYLTEEGIPIKPETTDTQLMTLGESTCERASETTDLTSWNQALEDSSQQDSISSSNSEQLTDVQIRAVLDASLRIYCPDEAARLGITQ